MQVTWFQSLRFRLISSIVVIELIMLSIMVWNNVQTIYSTHIERLNEFAISTLNQFAATAGTYMVEVDYASLEEYAASILQHNEIAYVEVLDWKNRPVVTVGSIKPDTIPKVEKYPTLVNDNMFDVSAPIKMDGRLQGRVYIGFSLNLMRQTINLARNRSILIASVEITLSVIATILLGLYLTKNLRALATAAVRVGEGNFNVELPIQHKDEVGLTSQAFNKMVSAIAERTRRIEDSQAHIQLLMDSTEEAIFGIDANGVCTFANAACVAMLGYQQESDLVGKSIDNFLQRVLQLEVSGVKKVDNLQTSLPIDASFHSIDEVYERADGSRFPVEFWSHPIKREGKTVGAVVTFVDITERKRIDHELKLHRDHLQQLVDERTAALEEQATIIDQIHDAVVSADLDGKILTWNFGAERLTGYTRDEAIGQHVSFVYPKNTLEFVQDELLLPLKEKGEHEAEVRMLHKNGESFFAHLSLSMRYDRHNNLVGMIGYAIDITQSKQAEIDLKRKARELEITNKELSAFSYSVSHDLRAPLRTINGFSKALEEDYSDAIDDVGKDYLHRISAGANRMALLIDDLLKLSRVTRDEIHWETVDLSLLARESTEILQQEDYDRQVEIDIQPDLRVYGDKRLLQIAIDNLFENAWKYTRKIPRPEFSFGMTQVNGHPIYFVKDNGAGFNMKYANKLFGAFQRLHSTNEFEGTGIGLATVQRIIRRHGGRVWAEAKVNEGATFYFTIGEE